MSREVPILAGHMGKDLHPYLIHASLLLTRVCTSVSRHLDRFIRFCRLTVVTNRHTDRRRRSVCCSLHALWHTMVVRYARKLGYGSCLAIR